MKITLLGTSGFPSGLAEVEKQKLFAKSLLNKENDVFIICNHGEFSKDRYIKWKGTIENIKYLYTSFITYRPESKIKRKLFKILGAWHEFLYLLCCNFDCSIISSRDFSEIFRYWIISKLKRNKIFLIIAEDPNTRENEKTLKERLKIRLFNAFVWKMVAGAFPISEYLISLVKRNNPNLPILKVPPLVDLDIFNKAQEIKDDRYFLFCGTALYFDIIKFIIDSFNIVNNKRFKLYLITNGNKDSIERIDEEITNSPKRDLIKRFGYLDYTDLVMLYKNASALLIPLRNNIQDIARFPHKIGEYSASGNPLISINFGEVRYYFTHLKDALISENYNAQEYANQMDFIINNPAKSKEIGRRGKELSIRQFDYRNYGERILNFLNEYK